MNLTDAQRPALKAYISNDSSLAEHASAGRWQPIADALNAASTAWVWRTAVPADEIANQVVWAALTPSDVVPTSGADAIATWQARSLACQGKQFNLQLILAGRSEIPGHLSNIRAGLQDALTNVPSGVGGATVSAGWVPVRDAMKRLATVAESIYATGTKTNTTPGLLVVEGAIDRDTVENAWLRG